MNNQNSNDLTVKDKKTNEIEKPFEEWKEEKGRLLWWDIYTSTKHNIVDPKATSAVALTMLKAFEVLLFCISARNGSFTIDYLDTPKLFMPEFEFSFALLADAQEAGTQAQLRFDGIEIQKKLGREIIPISLDLGDLYTLEK